MPETGIRLRCLGFGIERDKAPWGARNPLLSFEDWFTALRASATRIASPSLPPGWFLFLLDLLKAVELNFRALQAPAAQAVQTHFSF